MKKIALLLVLVMVLGTLTACGSPESTYNKAQKMLAQGEYTKAAELFTSIGSYDDASTLAMYCKACALCEEGNFEAGIAGFEKLGEFKDCDYRISYYTARSWDDSSVGTTEFEWMEKAIDIYNENPLFLDSAERIGALNTRVEKAKDTLYNDALALKDAKNYDQAIEIFDRLDASSDESYRDSYELANECFFDKKYDAAVALMNAGKYDEAITVFTAIWSHKDSKDKIQLCETAFLDQKYDAAVALMDAGKYDEALSAFVAIKTHKDSEDYINAILASKYDAAVALMNAGKYGAALTAFKAIETYGDSAAQIQLCMQHCTHHTASALGFAGYVAVEVYLDENGAIATLTIGDENFRETPGFGAKAQEEAFISQFVGKTLPIAAGEVDAIAGATITSNAVFEALNSIAVQTSVIDANISEKETFTASALGFAGPVAVAVTLDENGAIATLTIGDENFCETPGFGAKAQEEAFTSQFIGKILPVAASEVDAIAYATYTTNAVLEALNSMVDEIAMVDANISEKETLAASASGFAGPVTVAVTLDENGAIATLTIGDENFCETPGFGAKAQEEAFTSQFVGKTLPIAAGEVDAIAGATITSNAVFDALEEIALQLAAK